MENEIDFYTYGINAVKDCLFSINKRAEEIEAEYGKDARLEFEAGAASIVPQYANIINTPLEKTNPEDINFYRDEKTGWRNNSYFGSTGISKQEDEKGNYNEPEIKK